MELNIDDAVLYAAFLAAFRQADRDNAGANGETEVTFGAGGKTAAYYFKAPNFECVAYRINGGAKITLTKYNHVSGVEPCSVESFRTALYKGAGASPIVEKNMSTVIALTSEAARSKVVEANIVKAINYEGDFEFAKHEVLFKNYGTTAEKHGMWADGAYLPGWAPLTKADYSFAFGPNEDGTVNPKKIALDAL